MVQTIHGNVAAKHTIHTNIALFLFLSEHIMTIRQKSEIHIRAGLFFRLSFSKLRGKDAKTLFPLCSQAAPIEKEVEAF